MVTQYAVPMQDLEQFNNEFVSMAEHWDPFIQSRVAEFPNIWHDRIAREAYQLGTGRSHKTNVYRGGMPDQGGLATWRSIAGTSVSSSGGTSFNACLPPPAETYSYAWETLMWEGYERAWQSQPICYEDLKWGDMTPEQLSLIVRTGVDFGISIQENWNREIYLLQAALAQRLMVMTPGSIDFETTASYRFEYDPFDTIIDVDGATVPYILLDAGIEVSTLNWDYLDFIRENLAARAPEAALSRESGMPKYGLMIPYGDFEKMIKADEDLRQDWRWAQPQALIKGYDMGVRDYRGYLVIDDMRQMRFRVKGMNTDGKIVATRVFPLRSGRAVQIGQLPEPNPAYYKAELAIGVIFMNDVVSNQFVPAVSTLGAGTHFGPFPGLNGQWNWVNIIDRATNPFGQIGNFYGMFQIFPKPGLHSADCTVFLYRRCPQTILSLCKNDLLSTTVSTATAVGVTAAPTEDEFDGTNRTLWLRLESMIQTAIGTPVVVDLDGDGTDCPMLVVDASQAPYYKFAWESGATNAPSAHTDLDADADVTLA